MAYTNQQIKQITESIAERIMNGERLRNILKEKGMPRADTLYKWFSKDKELLEQYARACEIRADFIFDEIIEIADHSEEDHTPFTGTNVVQRDRVRIDARKWILSKMNPKKYSDKLDLTTQGKAITNEKTIVEFRDYTEKPEDE